MIRNAASGDIEGSTVVDAGTAERQPDRDVNALVDAEVFDRDKALVVVLRHYVP